MAAKRIDDICSIALLGIIVAVGGFAALFPSEAAAVSSHCTVTGTEAADVLNGTGGSDVLCGLGGDDVIHGRRGSDKILGGRGNDELAGGPGDDLVLGGPGDDDLNGGSGKDVLLGGDGFNVCHDGPPAGRLRACGSRSVSPSPGGSDTGKDRVDRPIVIQSFPCLGSDCKTPAPPPDTDPPQLSGLSLSPHAIDNASGSGTVELEVECWDPSGIESVVVTIEGPQGPWKEVTLEDIHNSQWFFKSLEISQTTEAGSYTVTQVKLTDTNGNERVLGPSELTDKGFESTFLVFEGPDETGPELTGLSISPTSVNTSSEPASIGVSMQTTDDLSGVAHAAAYVEFPNRSAPGTPGGIEPSPRLISGTVVDGTWKDEFLLPSGAAPGVYHISEVALTDQAHNETRYERDELETMGFPLSFTQEGPGDTTPPEILDWWMEPEELHAATAEGTIKFFVHVLDDLTGIGDWAESPYPNVWVGFEWPGSPSGTEMTGHAPVRQSGTAPDGIWRLEWTIPSNAPTGEYNVIWLGATDMAGNEIFLNRAELESRGWDLTFTNLP
jgi:hypothetical protein